MNKSKNLAAALLLTVSTAISGCATKSEKVKASYVSPVYYQNFTCDQLRQEAERVSIRAQDLAGVQDKKAKNDAVATSVALVVFWPAVFLVGGDNADTAELRRMKGEMDAIEQVSLEKRCDIQFRRS
jgi:hypothetical protein